MKCISVSQPFAELIVSGKKTVELRRWNTRHRGELLVHAPLRIRRDECRRLRIDCSGLAAGALVGKADLLDVIAYESAAQIRADAARHRAPPSYYARAARVYGFVLGSPSRFRVPVPMRGRLGIFDADTREAPPSDRDLVSDIIDEDFRYRLVGHH